MSETRVTSNSSWFRNVALLALGSGLFQAIYDTNDGYVVQNIFGVSHDRAIGPLIYIIFGAWLGIAVSYLMSISFGKKMDPRFTSLKKPSGKTMKLAFGAGLTGAFSTFFTLLGLSHFDPALVITLASASVIGVSGIDIFRKGVTWQTVLVPTILVFIGSVLVSTKFTYKLEVSILALIIISVCLNSFEALSITFTKEGSRTIDSVNFHFWRFLWLTLFGTILSVSFTVVTNRTELLLSTLRGGFLKALPFMTLTMVCVFISLVWRNLAFNKGEMSVVTLLRNSRIFMALSITYLLNYLNPGIFGEIQTDALSVSIRITGSVILFGGIALITGQKFFEGGGIGRKGQLVIAEESAM